MSILGNPTPFPTDLTTFGRSRYGPQARRIRWSRYRGLGNGRTRDRLCYPRRSVAVASASRWCSSREDERPTVGPQGVTDCASMLPQYYNCCTRAERTPEGASLTHQWGGVTRNGVVNSVLSDAQTRRGGTSVERVVWFACERGCSQLLGILAMEEPESRNTFLNDATGVGAVAYLLLEETVLGDVGRAMRLEDGRELDTMHYHDEIAALQRAHRCKS